MTTDGVATNDFFSYGHGGGVFTPVLRKKKRRGKQTYQRSPNELFEASKKEFISDPRWVNSCNEIILHTVKEMSSEIATILCLGLGSPTDSTQARFQLCFLLELKKSVFESNVNICAFDPVFTSQDKVLLESLGIQILTENQHGRHSISRPTLAYMPHCDRELYENFLNANWSVEQLSKLILIGNDLRYYEEIISGRILHAENPCISHLAPLLSTTVLPLHQAFPNAFSTTAVQHISNSSSLAGLTTVMATREGKNTTLSTTMHSTLEPLPPNNMEETLKGRRNE